MKQNTKKDRLDNFLVENGSFETKSQAQGAILAGKVKINGDVLTKAGTQIDTTKTYNIEIVSMPYVSRGGFKLEKAIKEFNIDLQNKICLDAGASTGGFTDCMLQNGAAKVYAVDVGYGQIAWKLRNHSQVVVIEKTNIRNTTAAQVYKDILPENINNYAEFCSADLSFISITKVLNNIKTLLHTEKQEILALIKPQFEAEKGIVPKCGVIKDKNIHKDIIKNIINFACEINFSPVNLTYSPIQGPAGNIEYLIYLKNSVQYCNPKDFDELADKTVENAHEHFNSNNIKK